MRKVTLRVISFKRDDDPIEYLYGLNETKPIELGDWYYQRELGKFACLQKAGHPTQTEYKFPVIECSTNPSLGLPSIPQAFVKQYFESNKEKNILEIRL